MQLAAINIGENFWLKENAGINGVPAYQSIGGFVSTVLPNVYMIAGVILFILLLAGGIMIISAAGQDESDNTKKGQQAVTAALTGFLIIFLSWWIIQIIETVTGLTIFKGITP